MTTKRKVVDPYNQAVPDWKEGFQTVGIDALRGVGFTLLPLPEEDGRTTVKRKDWTTGLTMYIEQDHTAGPQSTIRVAWMYFKPTSTNKPRLRPTYTNLTRELWEAIVYGSLSNSHLLEVYG
jgi:hypothetical protein